MIAIKDVSKAVNNTTLYELQAQKVRLVFKTGNKVIHVCEFINEDCLLKSGQLSAHIRNNIKDILEEATTFEVTVVN